MTFIHPSKARRPSPTRLCALVGAVALMCLSSVAAELREMNAERCRVVYARGSADLAAAVLRSTDGILEELHKRLGLWTRGKVTIHLTVDLEDYRRQTSARIPEWSSAAALPHERKVVVRAELTGAGIANHIVLTLRHELCHVALWEAERDAGSRLPLWFHEGVASWFGAGPFKDPQPFLTAAAHDALIPFSELEEVFPAEGDRARLAYLQSEYFIRFVIRERSPEVLRWWLDAFRESGDFEKAAMQALGEALPDVEARWRRAYQRRFPWLYVLWQATTLFGALAIAVIVVYFIRRARARRIQRAWEREEWAAGTAKLESEHWTVVDGEEPEEREPWG